MLGLGNSLSTTKAPSGGFLLTDIDGLDIWLQYNVGFPAGIANGETVPSWSDSWAKENHAVQDSTDFQPTYHNGAADFMEDDERAKLGFTAIENVESTIFIVIEADAGTRMTLFSSSRSSQVFYKINQTSSVEYRIRKGSTRAEDNSDINTELEPFVNATTPMLIVFHQKEEMNMDIHTSGNGQNEVHQHDNYGVQAGGTNTTLKIDQLGVQGSQSDPFNGRILEFAVYDTSLSDDNVLKVKENIAKRTGVNLG